jgi:hypothetical protein
MKTSLDPHNDPNHNDPNEAYEVIQTPPWLRGTPTDWWTIMANGIPVRHYPPHRKDLAIQYATDPAYRALLVMYDKALGARRRPPVASASR